MLLAVASSVGGASAHILDSVVRRRGRFTATVSCPGVTMAGWDAAAGTRVDEARGWMAEGWIDWNGAPCPEALREAHGDFALMADTPDGLLLGSGLASGYRPIYVTALASGTWVACTSVAVLRALLAQSPAVDVDFACASLVVESFPAADATAYRGIRRVPMGECWVVKPGREPVRLSRLRPLHAPELVAREGECAARLRDELGATIRRATVGFDRVAVSFSGGLDSSSVVALLCEDVRLGRAPRLPELFAIAFDASPEWDDAPYRRLMAERWSLPVHTVDSAKVMPFVRSPAEALVIDGMPCRAVGLPLAVELARRARANGTPLILTGEGGDDVLNGQPGLYGLLLRKGHPRQAVAGVLGLNAWPRISFSSFQRLLQLRTALTVSEPLALTRRRRRRALARAYPWAGPRLRRFLDGVADQSRPRLSLDASPGERHEALLSLRVFADCARLRAQEEERGGHVRRDPMLDDDFLRFVATIPPLSLLHGGYKRGLLRQAMEGLLPEALRHRQTKSFIEPAFVAMTAPVGGVRVIEDFVDVRMLADLGMVEPRPFRAHYEDVARRPQERGWVRLWAFVAAEAFLRQHAGEAPRAHPWAP